MQAQVDMADVANRLTVRVSVVRLARTLLRMRKGFAIVKLGARVAGVSLKIVDVESDSRDVVPPNS